MTVQASITIGHRTFQMPLDQLMRMLCGGEAVGPEALFRTAQLQRLAAITMRRAYPDRRLEFQLGRGPYWLGIGVESWRCRSLPEAIVTAMRWLHAHRPDAIAELSRRRKYTRAYVGTDPVAIYGGRCDLARNAREFAPGWYVDTNLSLENTKRFLADAFRTASLVRGRDWVFSRLDARDSGVTPS